MKNDELMAFINAAIMTNASKDNKQLSKIFDVFNNHGINPVELAIIAFEIKAMLDTGENATE